MKKVIFIFAIVCLATTWGQAQTAKTPAKKAPAATTKTTPSSQPQVQGPMIVFEKTTHDYGTVPVGSNGDCVFKFKNTGNEPLILMQVTPSCGCTTPTWSSEPIMPGKEGSIPVTYTHMNNVGSFSKTITVRSNSVTNGTILLTITGNIIEKAK